MASCCGASRHQCGAVVLARGALQLVYPVTLLDVTLPRGASFEEPVPPGHNVLALVIKGQVQVPGSAEVLKAEHAASLVGGQAVQVGREGHGGSTHVHGATRRATPCSPLCWPGDGWAGGCAQVSNPGAEEAQVVLFHGTPIDAPIVWRGPFCGNSQQQVAGWLAAYQVRRLAVCWRAWLADEGTGADHACRCAVCLLRRRGAWARWRRASSKEERRGSVRSP